MKQILETVSGAWAVIPAILKALITLVAGWIIAIFARFMSTKILQWVKFDHMSEKTGLTSFLRKGNVTYSPAKLMGLLWYWVLLIITFFLISRTLDISVVNSLSDQFFVLLPSILAAVFIVIIGVIVIGFVANFTITIARNASVPNARLLGRSIKYVGNILVITIALDQVGLGKTIISSMFQLLFGAAVFGVALAFGLGCKDIARDAAQRFIATLREKERSPKGTDLEG